MTQELSRNLMCICMRNGIELWLEGDQVTQLSQVLDSVTSSRFIHLPDGQYLNTADIVGVFKANTMESLIRRKNGDWQCQDAKWHTKGSRCECAYDRRREEEYKRTQDKLDQYDADTKKS